MMCKYVSPHLRYRKICRLRETRKRRTIFKEGLLFILCIMTSTLASANPIFQHEYCQNDEGNHSTSNITYRFLSNIIPPSKGNSNGFCNISCSQINSAAVYETGLCTGDIEPGACRSCLNHSAHLLAHVCPDKNGEAIGVVGFDECVLRFTNHSSFGLMETHPRFHSWNKLKVKSNHVDRFVRELRTILDDLKTRASAGDSLRKYATGNISTVGFLAIYALVQCMPDLSQLDCKNCLDEAFGVISLFHVRLGGRVVTPSCNFRYEVYLFYGQYAYGDAPPATPVLFPPLATYLRQLNELTHWGSPLALSINELMEVIPAELGKKLKEEWEAASVPVKYSGQQAIKKRNKFVNGCIVVLTIASVLVLIIFVGVYSRVKKANESVENRPPSEGAAEETKCTKCLWFDFSTIRFATNKFSERIGQDRPSSDGAAEEIECAKCLRFDFNTLRLATENFSEQNKIGQSMVGLVYRGRLQDGQNISVKKLYEHESYRDYFKNELKLASKLLHRNLVKLLGFCLHGSERFLVHEFVPTSLDLLLFDPFKVKHICLDWDRRSNIIRGIARGLLYLHEDSGLTIIHRDIRAGKILLDEELNPKIFGFGRAKFFGADQIEDASDCPNMWTSLKGCVAPEFFLGGLSKSVKTDVFSFGVLLLEIVTGQRFRPPQDGKTLEPTLISTVWRNWTEGRALEIVDPQIKDDNESEIIRGIHIGLLCIQENKDARPSMKSVVLMLNCFCFSLPTPSRPGYFQESTIKETLNGPSSSSSDLNSEVI